jgi:hypothetical protein
LIGKSDIIGWGAFSGQTIEEGRLVSVYVGEVSFSHSFSEKSNQNGLNIFKSPASNLFFEGNLR